MNESIVSSILRSFADDNRILKAIHSYLDVPELQSDLNNIFKWSRDNNMILHKNNFELLQHTCHNRNIKELNELHFIFYNNSHCYSTAKDSFISPSDTVKDLGVLVSADNSWSPHIGRMILKLCTENSLQQPKFRYLVLSAPSGVQQRSRTSKP